MASCKRGRRQLALPPGHLVRMPEQTLSKADVDFAIRHQNRINQFKINSTNARGQNQIEINRPARTAVVRPQTLFRPPHAVPNGQTARRLPREGAHVFTSAVVSIEEPDPAEKSQPPCE